MKGSINLTKLTILRKKTHGINQTEYLSYLAILPNITKIIRKNWNILQINENFKELFKNQQITALKRNKIIQEIIGTHGIENRRVKKDLKI